MICGPEEVSEPLATPFGRCNQVGIRKEGNDLLIIRNINRIPPTDWA
jgi:hypothetical protein